MVPGELSYFLIRKVAFSLLQAAFEHDPVLLQLLRAPLGHDLGQRRAGFFSRRHIYNKA